MAQIQVLDNDVLAELEVALARQAGSLLAKTSPGVGAERIEAAFADVGLVPSVEALRWWQWRDGSTLDVLPGCRHFSVDVALSGYRALREIAATLAAGSDDAGGLALADTWWRPEWVPIFGTGGGDHLVIDCGEVRGAPSPLRHVDFRAIGQGSFGRAFAPSLGDYVARAARAMRQGRYRYDAEQDTWLPMDWARIPAGEAF